jgi:probable HAF family extracellular repeat protein
MWFKTFRKSRAAASSRRQPTRLRSHTTRLQLEALEHRDVPAYLITNLGTLGGNYIEATDINTTGQVVGDSALPNGNPHAFLWRSGTMIDLGTLGGTYSNATGINDVGQVVGYSGTSSDPAGRHAFLLTPEDTDGNGTPDRWFRDTNGDGINDLMRNLGTPGGNNAQSAAFDVNNLGQVVGLSSWETPERYTYRACLWSAGVISDLGTGGGQNSLAAAINDAGVVVGTIDFGAAGSDAFVWKNGLLTDLDGLDSAADINHSGQIVGAWASLAVTWTPNEPNGTSGSYSLPLGTLPPRSEDGWSYSFPAEINNVGQVVGNSPWYQGGGSANRGFIYENGFMWELPLNRAMAINDVGQIVGDGKLLTPVVPQTAISMSEASVVEGNAGTTDAVFTISLSVPANQEVTVDYRTAEFGATAGDDYVSTSGTLHFAPGQTSQTVRVPVIGDLISEPDEYFYLSLSNPCVYAVIDQGYGLGTIVNDEPPEIRISDAFCQEGNAGTTSVGFYVDLSGASAQPVTVAYSTANGTATSEGDYRAASGTLTFAPGETSKTITVAVNGDRLPEPNETFVVNLSSPTNATIADGQGVGTIVDDEPHISISDVTKKEGKKGQKTLFTFTITLSVAYDQPVTMSFRTVNGTATTGDNDYVAQTGTLTFAPGETTKTITISVKGDSKRETTEYFYLDLFGNSSNSLFSKKRAIGTILNDD